MALPAGNRRRGVNQRLVPCPFSEDPTKPMWRRCRRNPWVQPRRPGNPFRPPPSSLSPSPLCCRFIQRSTYVDVKVKWKKDASLDGIEVINLSKDMRTLSSLKNIMMASPEPGHAIPVSAVSKMDRILEIPIKVSTFLRRYPSFFEEFVGPRYKLPWFKPTQAAVELHDEEQAVFEGRREELVDRVRRLIMMSREKRLPLQIVQGMQWYLGLPENFTRRVEDFSEGRLKLVEIGNGVQGLMAVDCGGRMLSVLQRNAMKRMMAESEKAEPPPIVKFPLFPSKGVRLKQKIINWMEQFQELPYVSPYDEFSGFHPNSYVAEKRLVGVLHELLSLFVDASSERRRILCLRKYLGLSQRFYKVFEHYPNVFYLHLKSKTCTVVLKEAYCGGTASAIEKHPVLDVRKNYVKLMKDSYIILRERRGRKPDIQSTEDGHDNYVD